MSGVAYTIHGEGPPVILLHGFCESAGIWEDLLPYLPSTFSYIIPDIPGFGSSPLPENKFSLSDIADTLLNWLTEIGITDFVLVGHSMGGYISLAMLRQDPGRCRGICLFHSTAQADTDEKKENRTKTAQFIRKNGKEAFLKTFIPGLYNQSGPWVEKVERMVKKTTTESILSYTLAMRDRPDQVDIISQFEGKSLFIAGEKDSFISADALRHQAGLSKNASFILLENIGHLGMMEDPKQSGAVLSDFIRLTNS